LKLKNYDEKVDIWSIGCILAELSSGKPLFESSSTLEHLDKIFQLIGFPSKEEITSLTSYEAKLLLNNFSKVRPQPISELLMEASDQ